MIFFKFNQSSNVLILLFLYFGVQACDNPKTKLGFNTGLDLTVLDLKKYRTYQVEQALEKQDFLEKKLKSKLKLKKELEKHQKWLNERVKIQLGLNIDLTPAGSFLEDCATRTANLLAPSFNITPRLPTVLEEVVILRDEKDKLIVKKGRRK